MAKLSPTQSQVATFDMLLKSLEHADYVWSAVASMDEASPNSEMVIGLTTDGGAMQIAYFDSDGRIIGNWL